MRSKMKKTFVIQVEYPDNDVIPSNEVMEVTQECIEHYMELHFGANIMDGDYDRIKVKEVTDGFSLVKRMREAQKDVIYKSMFSALDYARPTAYEVAKTKQIILEQEVDDYLKKFK
jgi:hypothetical protein